jgi:branched-chain amino acid transport system permease protein
MALSVLPRASSRRTTYTLLGVLLVFLLLPFVFDDFGVAFTMEILIWGLLALSFDFIYGYTGLLSLGQSVFFGLGIYGLTLAVIHWGAGLWVAMLAGLVLSGVAAAVFGYFAVKVRGHGFIIVTVVGATIITLIAYTWKPVTGGDDGLVFTRPLLALGPWSLDLTEQIPRYYYVVFFVALAYLLCLTILRSPLGRVFELIRENEDRARCVGYDTGLYKLISFTIAGTVAGLSGVLYSMYVSYASADFFNWLISAEALVWTLFGGAGTLYGALIGAGILIYLREALSSQWAVTYPIVLGIIIIVVVTFTPAGLVGTAKRIAANVLGRNNG